MHATWFACDSLAFFPSSTELPQIYTHLFYFFYEPLSLQPPQLIFVMVTIRKPRKNEKIIFSEQLSDK